MTESLTYAAWQLANPFSRWVGVAALLERVFSQGNGLSLRSIAPVQGSISFVQNGLDRLGFTHISFRNGRDLSISGQQLDGLMLGQRSGRYGSRLYLYRTQ